MIEIWSAVIGAVGTLLAAILAVIIGLRQYKSQQKAWLDDSLMERKKLELELAKEEREQIKSDEEKQFKIQFVVDCHLYRKRGKGLIVEVLFIITNNGSVEHRIYNALPYEEPYKGLQCLVRGLDELDSFPVIAEQSRLKFTKHYFKGNIIPQNINYYFIRPQTEQAITHVLYIPEENIPQMLQISGRFYYNKTTPHMTSRVFNVSPLEPRNTEGEAFWQQVN